jgi:hypothetical protein
LTVFSSVVLGKRYTNPSSDIIYVLAGLDRVDTVFSELVAALETTIRSGRTGEMHFVSNFVVPTHVFAVAIQQKAVHTSIAVVAGGYQTALVSYFHHRDFFPALMKVCFA